MAKILYIAFMLYILVMSFGLLFIKPWHDRSKGCLRRANRIPNYVLLFFCNIALILYPFTSLSKAYLRFTSLQMEEQYCMGIISIILFHMLAYAIICSKRNLSFGIARSFIAQYFRIFFTSRRTDEKDNCDIILSAEYAVIGTFGCFFGPLSLFRFETTKLGYYVIILSGLLSWLIYFIVAKIFKARYY